MLTAEIFSGDLAHPVKVNKHPKHMIADNPARVAEGIHQLHYLGAEHVFTDKPRERVNDRSSFKILRKVLCRGDKLILSDEKALGTKPAHVSANVAKREDAGIETAFVRREFFCENGSPAEQV